MKMNYFRKYGQDDRGFTLVELLVGLVLLSLIAVLMAQGITFGARVWERTSQLSDETEGIFATRDFLDRHLADIYPFYWSRNSVSGLEELAFEGGADQIRYIARLPVHVSRYGLMSFRLRRLEREAGWDLVLEWSPDLGEEGWPKQTGWQSKTLVAGASQIDFRYRGNSSEQAVTIWQDRQVLPRLVYLDIDFPEGDSRVWPEFATVLRVEMDAACRFDPVSRNCRGR